MSREVKPCGTTAAYQRHLRSGEEPCRECREAARRADRGRKRNRTQPRELQPCGTRAAYQRHIRAGEEPCEACREANRTRGREEWRKRNAQSCGTHAGYQRHVKAGERPCEGCRRAKAEYMARYRKRLSASPVVVPRVVQGPEGVGPCAVPANGFLWDPVRDDETPTEARDRQRVAAAICRTACPVFAWCHAQAPRVAGVVAGVRS